jgi:cytochrome c oxidase subunit I
VSEAVPVEGAEAAALRAGSGEPVVGAELERARRLTLRYLLAATAILGVAGIFGVLMRDSQANVGRLPDAWFYALMTAHGLGAFVGWAGFAVMGLSYWVLAQVGFPLRRFGSALAEATWWLMIAGVAGIVVTCVGFKYGGSWVFLYPISFHSAGVWGRWTAFFFSFSVLLVGLSIVTWCLSVLDTVLGPALHAVSTSVLNRLGVAMGFGYAAPKRFATNPRPVPYAVIPLTVIAIDMIIATLPLAVLLVEMMIQSLTPSVHVDPLLAKNVLWWFGHPVVYLLLFPAVAIYYLLVPRYAGRQLVAGNVIAVAWAIAVTANVLVWAHHIYIDYPQGSPQAALNVAMQPMTFALTVVSALSLYSLFFTMYRSRFQWNAAATALFLGLVSWLLSGLSGVINATIAFDAVVHNTLWIVGHFHQMALLNIGLVIIGATYAWLPELIGKPLYSEGMAKWHVWLTFLLATANSAVWLYQGLLGAPRRYAVLPHQYDGATRAAIPITIGLGAAQLLFAGNIVATLRGKGVERAARATRPRRRLSDAAAEALIVLLAIGLAVPAGVVGWVIGRYAGNERTRTVTISASRPATSPTPTSTSTLQTTTPGLGGGNPAAGKTVFANAGCAGCHTLKAAGAGGTIGPNLDQARPSLALAIDRVTHGKGAMPAFAGQLSEQQIKDVAAFVVASR